MRWQKILAPLAAAMLLLAIAVPVTSAQDAYAPIVDHWYSGYDRDGFYEDDWYYGDRGYVDPETGTQRVLGDPYADWQYEPLEDEWEIESVYGELDYEPEGYFEPSTRAELEHAIRAELRQAGQWDYEPLEGEWDYQSEGYGDDEIEYEPSPEFDS